ncbi:MAG: hypothetical protein KDB80_11030 [Planctomycetes bacterium]|nr:hypothetical protein [Planctomycetota bacterium]
MIASTTAVVVAQTQQVIYADGRRATVEDARKGSGDRWTVSLDGRRVVLRPGEVVAIVIGTEETVLIPSLGEAPPSPETTAMLASVADPKNQDFRTSLAQVVTPPTRAAFDAFEKLVADKNKKLRERGIEGLAHLRTRESVCAAAAAVLAEKDSGVRRDAASALFAAQEVFKRSDTGDLVKSGLEDKERVVRYVFAMLAPADDDAAKAILREQGIKDRDHHVRESAALELGRRGDDAGESILVGMLGRKKLPGFGNDRATMERFLIDEHVAVCAVLGTFESERARAALSKAAKSEHEAVRKAAEAALAAKR